MNIHTERELDVLERVLKKLAPQKGYSVWRGRASGYIRPKEKVCMCVVLFVSDGESCQPSPELCALVVAEDQGSFHVESESIFAFVHDTGRAIENVEEQFSKLPSFL